MSAAPDCGSFGASKELVLRPREQFWQRGRVECIASAEVRLVRAARELVPWANELTVVATEDSVAHQWAKLGVDRAFVFDRQVRDAAARIETIRADDRLRRADIDAARARTAMCRCRR